MWIRAFSLPAMIVLLTAANAGSPESAAAASSDSAQERDKTMLVVFETAAGNIEVALFPNRAPLSVAQFLAHVDAGTYEGASFYRVTRESDGSSIDVVQGGLLSEAARTGREAYAEGYASATAVAHETTDQTGIANDRATLAFARLEPGTADTEIFFNVRANPELDTGFTDDGRDGYGYATFGRVVEGMEVLDEIQRMPSNTPTSTAFLRGQLLEQPVIIQRIHRQAP